MTRKRSKYRPKGVIRDTMSLVKVNVSKVSPHANILRGTNRAALDALARGLGVPRDIDILIDASNMTTSLKHTAKDMGKDWSAEIRAGTDAVEAVQLRYAKWSKVQITDAEIAAIALMLDIHDAQLDQATMGQMAKAVEITKRAVTVGHSPAA